MSDTPAQYSILFVCMGNICRSPTAEGVLRHLARAQPLALTVDSAGTHDYHTGAAPDHRSIRAAARRGVDISKLRARQLQSADFAAFDLVLVMDERNYRDASAIAPPDMNHKLQRFMAYAPKRAHSVVPDPYYEGPEAFEQVLDLCEEAARGLLASLCEGRLLPR